ncbi:helix-turn-helix transcriptional regulator [Arabiibacter massiliensis]|uniref:helix-turn-helix transcriptional regulator n=1 Tax=Arabiibacter massiliensis TaxID=1870985 RepID=UPI0009B9BB97|nr:helix-turn-helix transcriptional regulator [Arabiibacter massiliensis]
MNFKALSGSSSWLAIVGAGFFWSWMDRAMFGESLYLADGGSSAALVRAAFIAMLAASVVVFVGGIALARRFPAVWNVRATVLAAAVGAASSVGVLAGSIAELPAVAVAGAVACGAGMAAFNLSWGRICIAQGPAKAMAHISGAWALGLVINLVAEGFVPLAEAAFVCALPVLSCALYLADFKLQDRAPYRIDESEGALSPAPVPRARIAGVDARFPAFILVFCIAFGLMCSFEIFTPADAAPGTVFDIVGLRGIVALLFFAASLTKLSRHRELLFNVCLTFMVFGVLVMTVGLYTSDVQGLTRVFIPIGYAGFDILVWTLIAFYGKAAGAPPLRVAAVAMGAEQAGILIGQLVGTALGGGEGAANNAVLMVLSYLLLVAVLGLTRLGTAVWRRQREEAPAGAGSAAEAAGDDHLARFADAHGLTSRERDIFALFAEGRSAPYIAEMLVLSENTVKTHMRHIYTKCDLHSRQELLDAIEAYKE